MKRFQHSAGLREIRSIQSIGARSIPKVQRSSYLELYMLRREKDRLEHEMFALDKRRNSADRQLNTINRRIEDLQKETQKEGKVKTYRDVPNKPLKTMAINY